MPVLRNADAIVTSLKESCQTFPKIKKNTNVATIGNKIVSYSVAC